MKRFRFLAVLLLAGLLTISCSEDNGGTSGGSGETNTKPAPQAAAKSEAAPQTASTAAAGSNNFALLFQQTKQTCADCGVWFDSAQLVVNHSAGTYTHKKTGRLLIKQSSGRTVLFAANLSSIPPSATINNATLYMRLNTHEGIANSDYSSVIEVYDFSSGRKGPLVKTITAAKDIKGKGYSKANPNVPIDFTDYARQVHGG